MARCRLEAYLADLVVDPSNGEILYVVLGNGCVYKSSNGGNTFQESSDGLPRLQRGVRSLAMDWKYPKTLYSAGFEGVFKTTDAGANWFSAGCNCRVREIDIDPTNSDVLYAAGRGDTGMEQAVKSTDGGKTWVRLNLPRFDAHPYTALAIDPRAPNVLFAASEIRGILKSTNAGLTWRPSNRGLRLGVTDLTADANRPGHMYAVAVRGVGRIIFETFNSGTNWRWVTALDAYDVDQIIIHPKNPLIVAAVAGRAGSGVLISTDGGKVWQSRGEAAARVFFDQSRTDTIFSLDYEILKSADLGKTWKTVTPPFNRWNGEQLTDMAIDPGEGRTLYATTLGSTDEDIQPPPPGRLFKSTNGGSSWKVIQAKSLPQIDAFWDVELNPKNPSTVYVIGGIPGGLSTIFAKSTDAGKTWSRLENFPGDNLSIDSLNPQRMLTYNNYELLFWTRDGGNTWQPIDIDGVFSTLSTAFFSPWQSKKIFAAGDEGVKTYTLK